MKHAITLFCTTILLFTSSAYPQQERQLVQENSTTLSSRRMALVIGNGAYVNAPPLKNPPNDAADMAEALSNLGFTVERGINLTQRQMKSVIREFGKKLRSGGQGLFYFAGHGVQMRGRNYLIPVDADIQSETDVEDQGVDANIVLGLMDEASNGLNVVILDACRNNPFSRSFRSATNGLAQMDAPSGTLIAYATAPGSVASDGNARNGIYTQELLKTMQFPGLSIEDVFKRVRISVRSLTAGKQTPWESSSLVGDFYFRGNSTSVKSPPPNPTDNSAAEEAIWDAIKSSKQQTDFLEFLKAFPKSKYVPQAESRLKELQGQLTEANTSKADSLTSESSKPVNSIQVHNAAAAKLPGTFSYVLIYVHGMSASADVKVFINNLDVSSQIRMQREGVLQVQAKYEKLNLKSGKNEVYVIVDGVKSEPYVFKQFE